MTEFGAKLRVKSLEAILFCKHPRAVVVSDVSVCLGGEPSLQVKTSGRFVFAVAELFSERIAHA